MLCALVRAACGLATIGSREQSGAVMLVLQGARLQPPSLPLFAGQQATPPPQSRQGGAEGAQTCIPMLCLQARPPHHVCSTEQNSRCRQQPLTSQRHTPLI